MHNTYKGSVRDGVKYLTLNGFRIGEKLNWGWYGSATEETAELILKTEFGPKVAAMHKVRFANEYLANLKDNFTLTSSVIEMLINKW